MNRFLEYVKAHRILSLTGVFAILLAVLCAMGFPAVNVHYSAVFNTLVAVDRPVSFVFDGNVSYPKSSRQSAYPVNGAASIRVDSLNQDSRSLSVVATGQKDASLDRLEASIAVGDRELYRAYTVPGDAFDRSTRSGSSWFTLDPDAVQSMRKALSFRSEIKAALIVFTAFVYLVLALRLGVLKSVDGRLFAAGLIASLLIAGFLLNVWLVRKPITYYSPSVSAASSSIDLDGSYEMRQDFVASQDGLRSIRLPVSVSPAVSRDDTANADFHKVYADDGARYRNSYVIEVRDARDGRSLFDGLLTPAMVSADAGAAEIPVRDDASRGRTYSVVIRKTDRLPSTVSFMGGDSSSGKTLSVTGTGGDAPQVAAPSGLAMSAGYRGFPYRTAVTCIVLAMLALIAANIYAARWRGTVKAAICLVDYLTAALYACMQFVIYVRYVGGFPDEDAHLSYIAYLQETGRLLPDFSRMQIYEAPTPGSLDLSSPVEFNRLGHPPLFYLIEQLLGHLTVDGTTVSFSLTRLRLISFLIGLAGIAIVFYIGFTRIRRIPILHLLFALMVISPPNVLYTISGVSNDSMALFSVSVFVLGMVRFIERRYDMLTYLIIACGVSLTFLSKLTAALMVACMAMGLLLYAILKEHAGRDILRRPAFWTTMPVYLVPAAYFGWLIVRFHTLQPSFQKLDFAGYVRSTYYVDIDHRLSMGVWEYAVYYLEKFLNTWQSLAGSTYVPKPDYLLYSIDRVAVMAVMIAPLLMLLMRRSRIRDYGLIAIGSVLLVMLYQAVSAFQGFHANGYPGAYSSRYYDCVVSVFALTIIWMICRTFSPSPRQGTLPTPEGDASSLGLAGTSLTVLFTILLVFDGFVFSVLYYADGVSGFTGA